MGRKAIYICGGLILILLIVAILLPFLIDANQFRPNIEAIMDSSLNRKVSLGNIRLAIFSGGVSVEDISISDDPSFAAGAFLKAKSLTLGVELMPLIFSRELRVTGLTIDEPQVTLLRSASGTWNFSTLGAKETAAAAAAAEPKAPQAVSAGSGNNFLVERLTIKNGKLLAGYAGAGGKTHEYDQLNLEASNLSYTAQFPFALTANTPGGGSVKLTGNAGPLNQTDMQQTPVDASLDVGNYDLTSSGFMDASSGIAGLLDFTGNLNSDGTRMNLKGQVSANKLQLVPGSAPARETVKIEYDAEYQMKPQTGELRQGDVQIGKALARLTGTFQTSVETTSVQMKLNGENMPAADLESVLPALGVILPSGASLKEGTLNADLTIAGPLDRLVTSGSVKLSNGKLTGFDLGSKLGVLSSFAGVPKGSDTVIETLSSDVRAAPDGIRADNFNLVVPAIGSLTGNGTISPDHKLDFKMSARLSNSASPLGGIAKLSSGGGGVPFKIQGTTSNPTFVPDLNQIAGGLAKGLLSNTKNGASQGQNLGGMLGGLLGKKK